MNIDPIDPDVRVQIKRHCGESLALRKSIKMHGSEKWTYCGTLPKLQIFAFMLLNAPFYREQSVI